MEPKSKNTRIANKFTKNIEKGGMPEVIKYPNEILDSTPHTESSKISVVPQLRTLYNSIDLSDYTKEKLEYEKQLYEEEKKKYTGKKKSFLSTLPLDNSLIKILDGKRINLLDQWNTKRIPVGGNKREDTLIIKNFQKLRIKDVSEVFRESFDEECDILYDFTKLDCGLNSYFPEMLNVPTVNGSVIDCLQEKNRTRFLNGYENKIFNNPCVDITEKNFYSTFRQMCRISTNTQPVGNFPTMVGMFIIFDSYYQTLMDCKYIPNDNFVILDPCAGWGGRLLGTLCIFHTLREDYLKRYGRQLYVTYLSTDPNTDIEERYKNIILDWFEFIEPEDTSRYFHFEKETMGCETPEFLDYCKSVLNNYCLSGVNVSLTSPPYYNREKYSDDDAQSYKRYKTYPVWRDKFLQGTIKNVSQLLLPYGRFYLNIADTLEPDGSENPMESDSIRFFKECGMKEVKTYKMLLSGSSDSKHKVRIDSPEHKFEPVFVYEK